MKKPLVLAFSIIILSLGFLLFFGMYEDDEFGENRFFIKHRPTWKWYFYSPIGMSDMKIEDLPKDKQSEERYFEEFVRQRIIQ